MRLYRVEKLGEAGMSFGFSWFSTSGGASAAMADWISADPDNQATLNQFDLELTPADVFLFLNRVAVHPDNG